ncbi:protein BCCIP homolog isoform X2 [Momordica charantia]|uniref:Protein BCCIP homolog n=1 Tax=Momordica charantia TaxID=3673 RepID=A0A6J1DZC2_MOMCH|nr:protein BCCIP homolog isoform X2 [Momordica charantia]
MPRRPTKRRQPLGTRPLTFSSFARASCMVRNQILKSKYMKSHPKHEGNGFIRNSPEAQSDSSDSSSSDEDFEEIQADFAFFDPKPDDFHGVKTLLHNYLDDTQWDLSGFSDLILGQTTVGTVIKVEGDEDNGVFSFITALNLERYKDSRCILELKGYLLKVCQEKDLKNKLKLILEEQASSVGLLVSQRIVNLPPQLLPPLYDALFDEISWAIEDELKNPNHKKRLTSETDESIIYVKPEDEIFHKLCVWSFCFPLHIQPQTTNELKGYQLMGMVMAVEARKIPTFRDELKSLISEASV